MVSISNLRVGGGFAAPFSAHAQGGDEYDGQEKSTAEYESVSKADFEECPILLLG